MSGDIPDVYKRLGTVMRELLKYAMEITHPGMPVLELCERIEGRIRELGVKPAFPVNVSINEVAAHYTAVIGDKTVIPKNSIVKVDIGIHEDGYIVDAAVTISFNPIYDTLLKAAAKALEAAIYTLRPGVQLREVGARVERVIRSFGFRPIENLTGHLIRRYELHAGKSIPNYDNGDRQRVLEDEVYAIEPFATTGKGYVVDSPPVTIYRLPRGVKGDEPHQEVLKYIEAEFKTLPFTPRWLVGKFGHGVDGVIHELYLRGVLQGYPVLIEGGRGIVAQFEDTVIITRDGAIPIANTLSLV